MTKLFTFVVAVFDWFGVLVIADALIGQEDEPKREAINVGGLEGRLVVKGKGGTVTLDASTDTPGIWIQKKGPPCVAIWVEERQGKTAACVGAYGSPKFKATDICLIADENGGMIQITDGNNM